MNIKHQIQPTWNSCMAACLGMILNKNVGQVHEEFTDLYIANKLSPFEYLIKRGFNVRRCYTDQRTSKWGELYILAVPSLNILTVTHAIIIDYRETGIEKIYDPNRRKRGKKYYDTILNDNGERIVKPGDIIPDTNDLGYALNGFSFEYEITYPEDWESK